MSVQVVVHGCRSNLAERDALAALAPAGSTVINSCAVTASAVRDARAAARRAARCGPVFVTGCAATVEPSRFGDVAIVVPNSLKLDPAYWNRPSRPMVATRQARAFLAIQDGCDHACTFCITRIARGRARSTPLVDVLAAARRLVETGVPELVLTGIDLSGWGEDLDGDLRLGHLVQALLAGVDGLRRLRLSSIDGAEADDALIEAFGDARVMPQAHLSLQSGDDLVLARMKRRHRRADALRLVARLKAVRPDIAIGADLIAGFPTESADAHARSLSLIAEADIVQAHIFPFSPRPGTPAARMPRHAPLAVRARAAELRAVAAAHRQRFLERLVGQAVETVSEGETGITPHGARLRYAAFRPHGACTVVTVGSATGGSLTE